MARILCVDDEPNAVALKCAILESAGHTVTSATSAREALDQLENASFDAVVTDWRLGDGSGSGVVQAAKSRTRMPVVVVSGFVSEAFTPEQPMADLYLEKPVKPEDLVNIINELVKDAAA